MRLEEGRSGRADPSVKESAAEGRACGERGAGAAWPGQLGTGGSWGLKVKQALWIHLLTASSKHSRKAAGQVAREFSLVHFLTMLT